MCTCIGKHLLHLLSFVPTVHTPTDIHGSPHHVLLERLGILQSAVRFDIRLIAGIKLGTAIPHIYRMDG